VDISDHHNCMIHILWFLITAQITPLIVGIDMQTVANPRGSECIGRSH